MKKAFEQVKQIIESSSHILIIQADNPDADSLGSALAIEEVLNMIGKEVTLYCGVDMPGYLHYLEGWSRVGSEIPKDVDCWLIVDASTNTLIEKFRAHSSYGNIQALPSIVLDHHAHVQDEIKSSVAVISDSYSSTGELIYALCLQNGWNLSTGAKEYTVSAILGDTQGLSNNLATPDTYRIIADLIESGLDRGKLEEARRQHNKLTEKIYRYKAELIKHTELFNDNSLAIVHVPQEEITTYSPLYNPAALIQPDLLQIEGVKIAIVIKTYRDGKITAAIRCNLGTPIAAKLALEFGGGGHNYASGFKLTDGRPYNEVKSECIHIASKLTDNL